MNAPKRLQCPQNSIHMLRTEKISQPHVIGKEAFKHGVKYKRAFIFTDHKSIEL